MDSKKKKITWLGEIQPIYIVIRLEIVQFRFDYINCCIKGKKKK